MAECQRERARERERERERGILNSGYIIFVSVPRSYFIVVSE